MASLNEYVFISFNYLSCNVYAWFAYGGYLLNLATVLTVIGISYLFRGISFKQIILDLFLSLVLAFCFIHIVLVIMNFFNCDFSSVLLNVIPNRSIDDKVPAESTQWWPTGVPQSNAVIGF